MLWRTLYQAPGRVGKFSSSFNASSTDAKLIYKFDSEAKYLENFPLGSDKEVQKYFTFKY